MAKEMTIHLNPFSSVHRCNHIIVRFIVSFLLIGLAFRLFVSDSFRFSPVAKTPPALIPTVSDSIPVLSIPPVQPPVPLDFQENEGIASQNISAKCDLFIGNWVPDPSGPAYTNESCRLIEDHQNCLKNGRPDSDYLYWRWKPRDCDLPRLNPIQFLDLVRHKSLAFIGDSIMRNHVQSLLCILSQVEEAVEIYHDEEYRSKTWKFESHNFTLSVIWAPFLLKAEIFENQEGISSSDIQLHLDKLDSKWSNQYKNFDYIIVASGKWFLKTAIYHENSTVTGCHYCPGKNLTELGFDHAYRKAVNLVLKFITESNNKAVVIWRSTTPDHFENGEWFSGGTCNRTMPFREGEIELKDVDRVMREIELDEFEKAKTEAGEQKDVVLKLLDTTRMSMYRPDGHPGPYRYFHPSGENTNGNVNDCLHWCLPGPIDSWNDLVMEMLIEHETGRR